MPGEQHMPADLDRLVPPAEALDIVLSHAARLPTESVPVVSAAWRVLAGPVFARENHPPFAASTMDGFAVSASDVSPWREVIGVQTAGSVIDVEVTAGTAVRITTGAPIPAGADAVVQVEHTEPADDHVIIHQEHVSPGENIRPIGADVLDGQSLLAAGTLLGPAEIGILAGLGMTPIDVVRRPRVSVLSTGDELVEPDQPLGPGQIRDSNRFSLLAALAADGVDVIWSGKAADRQESIERLLQERIAESDVVITSGGVSMGELDLIKATLGTVATVHLRRVFMKPGKPFNFATSGSTLIFGLSGNPVATMVGYEVFVRPALRALSGLMDVRRAPVAVTLTHLTPPTDRIEYQRAVVSLAADGRLEARTTGAQASSRLLSLVGANALLIIPPRDTPYLAGEQVEAILLDIPRSSLQ